MKKQLASIFAAGLIVSSLHAAAPSKEASDTAKGVQSFGFELFKSLYNKKGAEPVAVSPLSITEAMTLAAMGSEATTRSELESLFGGKDITSLVKGLEAIRGDLKRYARESNGAFTFTSSNALWANSNSERDFKFRPAFLAAASASHGAALKSEDFAIKATIKNINAWVEKNTEGKIKELLKKLEPNDVAVLLNAIYAKGKFLSHFKQITEGDYVNAQGVKSKASYLSQTARLAYAENKDVQMLSLPIGDKSRSGAVEVALDILVPQDGKLDSLIAAIDSKEYGDLVSKMAPQSIALTIAAGKVEQGEALSLVEPLKAAPFRVLRPFDADAAEFGLLGQTKGKNRLYISDILTKTFYEVTPFGFEAAAATAVVIAERTAIRPEIPQDVSIKGPSVHVVRHVPTGLPLFISVYDSPQHYDQARIVELIETGVKADRYLSAQMGKGFIHAEKDYKTKKTSIVLKNDKGVLVKVLKNL